MLQRTNKLLIGKDIARDAQATAATTFAELIVSTALQAGEVIVLDKNKVPLAAGSTISDSDVIFVCQGTSAYTYTTPAGTVVNAIKVKISDPIEGAKVKKYVGTAFEVKSEQTIAFTPSGTPTAGLEYVVRIEYKDMPEHPGQFTQTYRFIATSSASWANVITGLTAKINSHKGRRVNATDGTTVLTLTGKEISEGATSLTDIDKFSMVEFSAQFNYVNTLGGWTSVAMTTNVTVPANYGNGNWEQVRDIEKEQMGYNGVMNLIHFPVIIPEFSTVVDAYYDIITIEHDKSYLSPDNQYVKQAPLTTQIAFATNSNGIPTNGQSVNVVGILNTWMASCSGAFAAISI